MVKGTYWLFIEMYFVYWLLIETYFVFSTMDTLNMAKLALYT